MEERNVVRLGALGAQPHLSANSPNSEIAAMRLSVTRIEARGSTLMDLVALSKDNTVPFFNNLDDIA